MFQDGDGDKFADVGELISYSFLVKNIGNVTLSNISVTDPNVSSISCPVVGNPIPTLAVGASQTCTGSYAITQADIDAGQKLNTALASGKGPQGQPASDEDDNTALLPQKPAITIVKTTADAFGNSGDGIGILPGQNVTWKYVVTNAGNVTLSNIAVTDDNGTPANTADDVPVCTLATLAVGTSDSCSATGTAKAGWYKNLGTAAGSGPQGQPVKASDASSYYGLTPGAVTNSSLCDFGDQFRLIFTPDMKYYTSSNPAYKLSDSNPGQFFYNVFHVSRSQETIQLEIPYPYVTQGANPVHLYGGLSVNQSGGYNCFAPTNELASYASTITLGSYTDTNTDGKVGYGDVYRVEVPAKLGFQYVNIHLDYGLEKTNGWIKKGSNVTNNPTIYPALNGVAIVDNTPHTFQAKVNGFLLGGSSDTVYNLNEFKQIRGFGGLVYVKTGCE